jgi:putative component of membrane protein insertase Oxa1/YidC/SpoIIIJ protein YidD
MPSKVVRLGETAKLYGAFIKRLKALGCVFCPTCYAYMAPEHQHVTAFEMKEAA